MDFTCEERSSDSLYVERIWHSRSDQADPFISMADDHVAMVVTKTRGHIFLTLRGPETRATPANSVAEAEIFGIQFKIGVYIPHLPPQMVMDRRDVNLPDATGKSFWLNSAAWQYPDFENADTFVDRLVREGLLVYDPIVGAVLQGQPAAASLRTVQRRFLQATGLTFSTVVQIERARYAVARLKQGASVPDAAQDAGYYDQPHLTRMLKTLVGLTPARIVDPGRPEILSYLYKTTPAEKAIMPSIVDDEEINSPD